MKKLTDSKAFIRKDSKAVLRAANKVQSFKFGLLTCATNNLGDFIQSLAAKQFLPSVDVVLDRDYLHRVKAKQPIKVIMNGWFLHQPKHWPPSHIIKPLFISFHITPTAAKRLTAPDSLEYFKKYEPIGCRDYFTLELLKEKNVKTYFSGCLTLTFQKTTRKIPNTILLVDLDEKTVLFLPETFRKIAQCYTHYIRPPLDVKFINFINSLSPKLYRFLQKSLFGGLSRAMLRLWLSTTKMEDGLSLARRLLDEYASASLVITSRLHCALPCLAFGTPVIFVSTKLRDERLRGYEEYLNICSPEDLATLNWEKPISNPKSVDGLRRSLVERCVSFVSHGQ